MLTAKRIPSSLIAGVDYNADELRRLRDEQDVTQEVVADNIGVSRMMIFLAETRSASFRVLKALSAYYGVPLGSLLYENAPRA